MQEQNYDQDVMIHLHVQGDEHAMTVSASMADSDGTVRRTIGSSKCSPEDKHSYDTGFQLAAGRAVRQLGRELLKEGNAAVAEAAAIREEERILQNIRNEQRKKRTREIRASLRNGLLKRKKKETTA